MLFVIKSLHILLTTVGGSHKFLSELGLCVGGRGGFSKSRGGSLYEVFAIPVDGFLQAGAETNSRFVSDYLLGQGNIGK